MRFEKIINIDSIINKHYIEDRKRTEKECAVLGKLKERPNKVMLLPLPNLKS